MVFPFELLSCMQMGVLKQLQLLDNESIHWLKCVAILQHLITLRHFSSKLRYYTIRMNTPVKAPESFQ